MWHLLKRDWLDLLGDVKYLFITLGVPLLATPLLILLLVGVANMKSQEEAERQYRYIISSENVLPQVSDRLNFSSAFHEFDWDDHSSSSAAFTRLEGERLAPKEWMKLKNEEGEYLIDVYFLVESSVLGETKKYSVTLLHRETNPHSELKAKVNDIVETVRTSLREQISAEAGITADAREALVNPVQVEEQLVKEQKELVGQHLGTVLNFILIIWVFTAMMTVTAELVTGEKENKTMETLLVSPLSKTQLGLSKWVSLMSVGMFSSFITLFMYYLSLTVIRLGMDVEMLDFIMSLISVWDVLVLWVLLLPLCTIIAGALVVVAINASTLKEFQSAASFLMLLLMAPLMLLMTSALEWNEAVSWMPAVNLIVSNVEVVKGTFELAYVVPLAVSNTLLCVLLAMAVRYLFNNEKVLLAS